MQGARNTVPLTMQEYCSVKLSANLQSVGGNTFEEEKPISCSRFAQQDCRFRWKLGRGAGQIRGAAAQLQVLRLSKTCEKAQSPLHNAYICTMNNIVFALFQTWYYWPVFICIYLHAAPHLSAFNTSEWFSSDPGTLANCGRITHRIPSSLLGLEAM